jgi:hypothetical protein
VERREEGGAGVFQFVARVAARAGEYWDEQGLTVGAAYEYRVRVTGGAVVAPFWSSAVVEMTVPAPAVGAVVRPDGWTEVTWTGVPSDATAVVVERSVVGGAGGFEPMLRTTADGPGIAFVEPAGFAYVYRVRVEVTPELVSAWSTAGVSLVIPTPNLAVSAAVSSSSGPVQLTWTGVPAGATFVNIERALVGDPDPTFYWWAKADASAGGWADWSTFEGESYVYRVRMGNERAMSDAVEVHAAVPPAIGGFVNASPSGTGVRLAWEDLSAHELGYRIERSADGGAHFEVLAESFQYGVGGYQDLTVAENTTYTYRVTAVGAFAESAPAWTTLTTGFWAPSGLTATVLFPTSVRLTWSDNSQFEAGFALSISCDGGLTWNYLYNTPANTTELLLTGLARGQSYGFRIGFDVWSPNAEGMDIAYVDLPLSLPGAAPGDLAATTDAHAVHLTWVDQTSGETGWRVRRSDDGGATFNVIAELPAGAQRYDGTGLSSSTRYVYSVVPVTGGAEGDAGTITATTAPNPPLLLSGQAIFRDLIQLNWDVYSPDVQSLEIRYLSPVDGTVHTLLSGVDPALKMGRIGSLEGGAPFAGLTYTMWLVAVGPGGSTEGNSVYVDTSTGTLGLTARFVVATGLMLDWEPVYGNGTLYDVWWSTDGVTYKQRALTSSTDLNVTGLWPDMQVWFKMRLVGPRGGATSFADPITVRTTL